ncbi:hypothetical protein SOM61_08630 [Massilia sp. CFBP9012]|uniref:hypothetical protein n=1 Tax=Massilia sp. CFBP9012 TaxID=3096531 RepID=UPI002A69D6D4|nr:hypothetical protein [Massilia sp. CFBP9012]MDY0975026.1 hypothetical protein [Massilia sp. CFBP9012]
MFSIPFLKTQLASVNARAELHGKEKKPAFDLKLIAAMPNDVLFDFHPLLRTMLYKPAEQADQVDLVDQADPEALTALRLPKLGKLKWEFEAEGYSLRIAYGIGGKSDINLSDCKVHKVSFVCQEGGTVLVECTVIAHPETAIVGRLCEMIQQTVEMELTPPEPETLGQLFGEAA